MRIVSGEFERFRSYVWLTPDEQDPSFQNGERILYGNDAYEIEKIHFPSEPKERLFLNVRIADQLFSYSLCDAWHRPFTEVVVLNNEEPAVLFCRIPDSDFPPPYADYQRIRLEDQTVKQLTSLLSAFDISKAAAPEELRHMLVLDGVKQQFFLSDGTRSVSLSGSNMIYYLEKPRMYPKAVRLIRLLQNVQTILAEQGVDPDMFRLESP